MKLIKIIGRKLFLNMFCIIDFSSYIRVLKIIDNQNRKTMKKQNEITWEVSSNGDVIPNVEKGDVILNENNEPLHVIIVWSTGDILFADQNGRSGHIYYIPNEPVVDIVGSDIGSGIAKNNKRIEERNQSLKNWDHKTGQKPTNDSDFLDDELLDF